MSSSSSVQAPHPPEPHPARAPALTPVLWGLWLVSVTWTAAAAIPWWSVTFEERFVPALTLQTLADCALWGVDLLHPCNAVTSPLPVLLGRVGIGFVPSALLTLWLLGLAGVALLALGALATRWTPSRVSSAVVALWLAAAWSTHPLVLASLGLEWTLALGLLALGAALTESRWPWLGWLVMGAAALGRPETMLGAGAVMLWHRRASLLATALVLTPAGLWALVSLAAFGSLWSEAWWVARPVGEPSALASLVRELVRGHPVWCGLLLALSAVGAATLRQAPALVWGGVAAGLASAGVTAALAVPLPTWWWHLLGPLLGLLTLAAGGLGWLLDPDRRALVRIPALGVALGVLGAQWAGTWGLAESLPRHEAARAWSGVGAWLRANVRGDSLVLSTQPATLMWHVGLPLRLTAQRVEGLSGVLAADSRRRDEAEVLRGRRGNYAVARLPEDAAVAAVLQELSPAVWTPAHLEHLESGGVIGVAARRGSGEVSAR